MLAGGGLAGPVNVGLTLAPTSNVKLDIVSGTELKTSASATVSGAVTTIEGMGVRGLALTSTGGADRTVLGTSGDDAVAAAGGHNVLRGNSGNDTVAGGSGFDDINGNMGNDTAYGNVGDDWVVGGKDNDSLFGDDGGDIVFGNLGDDTCDGGAGNDLVRGGQGNDTLSAGGGNDFVSGDRGNDTMVGGAGADMFHSSSDAGVDRVLDFDYAEGDRVLLDPGTRFTTAQVGGDIVVTMATSADQVILAGVQLSSLPPDWIFGA
jgi:Ca2+-binding RTX toxin-like protein